VAGLHGDGEGDCFESGNEVEGAFFWDRVEALSRVRADGQGAFWFGDVEGFGIGLGDGFCRDRDYGEDELQW